MNTIETCVVTNCTNLLLAHILDSLSLIHSTHTHTRARAHTHRAWSFLRKIMCILNVQILQKRNFSNLEEYPVEKRKRILITSTEQKDTSEIYVVTFFESVI